jgi:hypothetical protein
MSVHGAATHTVHIIDQPVPAAIKPTLVVETRGRRRSASIERRQSFVADYVRAALDAREDQGLPRFVEDHTALELIAKILGRRLEPVGGIASTSAA